MFNTPLSTVAICCALVGLLSPRIVRAQGEWSDAPPAQFRKALSEASGPFRLTRAEALERLAAEPAWEPYLRSELNATTDEKKREMLRFVLLKCQDDLFVWNLERAKKWGKDLHLDYLADLARFTDDPKRAWDIADLVKIAEKVIHDKYKRMEPYSRTKPSPNYGFLLPDSDSSSIPARPPVRRFSGDRVEIPDELLRAYIHTTRGTIGPTNGANWISLSRDQLKEIHSETRHRWTRSVVVVCSSGSFVGSSDSLIVCDGDIELTKAPNASAGFTNCVIIANGDISFCDGGEPRLSFIYAAGDFNSPSYFSEFGASIVCLGSA